MPEGILDLGDKPQSIPSGVIDLGSSPDIESVSAIPADVSSDLVDKQEPGFLKKLDMINTGVHRGVTKFTLALMSKLPFGEKYQNAIKQVDKDVNDEQEYNKKTYSGYYPQGGELAGEMIATLPAGGLLGKVGQGAIKAGELMPTGLKTLFKYGTAGVGGAEALALMESQKYDPEKPGQLFNSKTAGETMGSPLSYAIPMVGTKLNTWLGATEKLGKAREIDPYATANSIKDPDSASKKFGDQFFGILPALTEMGHAVKQRSKIGDAVGNWINSVSTEATKNMSASQLMEYAGNQVKGALNVTKLKGDLLWDKPFKYKSITDPEGLKDDVINALDIISNTKKIIPSAGFTEDSLKELLRTKNLTVDTAKNIRSALGDTIYELGKLGPAAKSVKEKLSGIKDNVFGHIQKSIGDEDLKDFNAALEYSSMFSKLKKDTPLVRQAIFDNVAAIDLVRNLTGTKRQITHSRGVLNEMTDKGKDSMMVAQIAEAMEKNKKPGGFDLNGFLNSTKEANFPESLRKSELYNSFEGLQKYLSSVNDASKVTGFKQMALGAGLVGATGLGATISAATAAAPVVGYMAANLIANHSLLKRIFHAIKTKALPENTYEALKKAADKHLTRAGYIITEDGSLRHKNDKSPTLSLDDEEE